MLMTAATLIVTVFTILICLELWARVVARGELGWVIIATCFLVPFCALCWIEIYLGYNRACLIPVTLLV